MGCLQGFSLRMSRTRQQGLLRCVQCVRREAASGLYIIEHNEQMFFFYIKRFSDVHSCGMDIQTLKNLRVSSNLVSSTISEIVRDKPLTRPCEVATILKRDYGLDVSYHIWYGWAWRKQRLLFMKINHYRLTSCGLFSVAFAIVDSETTTNWSWFLHQLGKVVDGKHHVTFISDRNIGLLEAMSKLFPSAHHGFHEKLEKLKEKGKQRAYNFFKKLAPEHWANSYFSRSWQVSKANEDVFEIHSIPSVTVDIARQTYRAAYSDAIFPIPLVEKPPFDPTDFTIYPPTVKRPPGRLKKNRIPSRGKSGYWKSGKRCSFRSFFLIRFTLEGGLRLCCIGARGKRDRVCVCLLGIQSSQRIMPGDEAELIAGDDEPETLKTFECASTGMRVSVCKSGYQACGHQYFENQLYLRVQRFGSQQPVFSFTEARQKRASQGLPVHQIRQPPATSPLFSRLVMTQNLEEIVVMAAALNQGITIQGETDVEVQHPPRSPAARPIWEPQLFQTREPTTFELMGMIGDLQRSMADLAYGMSAPPPTASYVGNFMLEEPPLLGRIMIELSQPEAIPSSGNGMSTTTGLRSDIATQTFHQAEASGKDKVKVDSDPYERLLWAVEALKVGELNRQQVLAVTEKTVDDSFPTQSESSSSQGENRDKDPRTRTVPSNPNPAPGKDQKTKSAPTDPFASASGKSPQTLKYLPRGRRVFHALYMPLSKALQILAEKGNLKPLEPRPLLSRLPSSHDAA
ncbi:hypothetical protein HYC85_029930 [Camellia sinensis]|uniref:MULE transposase domain-containing protein n=1 Tax=Camellia sinensis TaxID=4442 RepID=A0A7J7FZG7_CAMSI|nr:hypothetical protein HYC85_029930 [Camellia sinensis]